MKKQLSLLLCTLFLTACHVTFVPDFDASIAQQITDAAKANDKLYIELLSSAENKRSYQDYEKEYIQIESEINSINLKNEVRKKNADMLDIIKLLHDHFNKYRDKHKNSTLSNAIIIDYENDMNAFWKALLLAEKGLPHKTPAQ